MQNMLKTGLMIVATSSMFLGACILDTKEIKENEHRQRVESIRYCHDTCADAGAEFFTQGVLGPYNCTCGGSTK